MTSYRCLAAAALCLLSPFAMSQAPVPVAMSPNVASPSGSVPQNIYAVDLNNDGVLDLVQDTVNQPNGFTVSIANGNGTFKTPVFLSVPDKSTETDANPTPIATGDFNNDGKADVVVQVSGTNQLEVFLGKGDGTFQAPKAVSVSLPSGYYLTSAPIVAADFNQDGNVDLVVVASSSGTCCTNTVYVLEGNGEGSFSSPHAIYTDTGNHLVDGIVIGDFDGDSRPDIALTDDDSFQGSYFGTSLVVLYGNGDFTFDKSTVYTVGNSAHLSIASGDLNSDGKTDLFGLLNTSSQQLAVFYAGSSRTFESYFMDLSGVAGDPTYPYFPLPLTPELTMADFNGDGRMDIAAAQGNSSGAPEMVYLLAGVNPGEFTMQTSPLQNLGSDQFFSNPVVADENHDSRPDIVINQASSDSATSSSITTTQVNNTTEGTFSNCAAPGSGNGILLCSPATNGATSSPLKFSATAISFGQLRKIELWVDGAKVNEQYNAWEHNAWLAWSGAFASGSHYATLYASDIDNRHSQLNFDFTVSGPACPAPSSDGVNVCAPNSSYTSLSPVQVAAAAKIAGTLNRMEIWVDGEKIYSETTSLSFNTALTVAAGSHRFDIYAVNNAGTKYETTVYATVN